VCPQQRHTPGSLLLLAENPNGPYDPVPPPADKIWLQLSSFDIQASPFPAEETITFQVSIPPPQSQKFHIQQVSDDPEYHIPFLDHVYIDSPPWFLKISPSAHCITYYVDSCHQCQGTYHGYYHLY
jgi:hypothetical protein